MAGDITIATNGDTGIRQLKMTGGNNDFGRIAVGATASNAGWMELATCDDGTEPIYARQYTGSYASVKNQVTLLDASGNTSIPKDLNVGGYVGAASVLFNNNQRFNYGLAYYNTFTNTVTGTIVITLPNGWNNGMNTYEIDLYEYKVYDEFANDIQHSKIIISGYNYSGSTSWANYGYKQIGPYNKGVRLGYDGSKCIIMLGTTTTKWTYPQVHLSRVITGFQNQTSWSTGYSISVITDESSYSKIVTANRLRQRFGDVVANYFRANTSVITPKVQYDDHLRLVTTAASKYIYLRYNNSESAQVVFTGTYFSPSSASSGLINLGTSGERWANIYAVTGNFLSNVESVTTTGDAIKHAVTNSNGSIELLVHSNRGLYDRTNNKWIIYVPNGTTDVRVPAWNSKGSST